MLAWSGTALVARRLDSTADFGAYSFVFALLGDPPLFPRHEEVELQWRILDPILEHWEDHGQPEQYTSGGWGPAGAYEMLARDGRSWRRP